MTNNLEEKFPEMVLWGTSQQENYFGKFILIQNKTKENFLFGEAYSYSHLDIYWKFLEVAYTEYKIKNVGKDFSAKGGGRLRLDVLNKTIDTSEYSKRYGRYNQKIAKEIIIKYRDEFLPDFAININ